MRDKTCTTNHAKIRFTDLPLRLSSAGGFIHKYMSDKNRPKNPAHFLIQLYAGVKPALRTTQKSALQIYLCG
jgi:hypothetical protein